MILGELRKDYILDKYVIIATERAKRPDQFKLEPNINEEKIDYFAPGNEHLTPPEILRYPHDAQDWKIRVFPNKFAAVNNKGNHKIKTDNKYYTYADAYGYHEIIVECPDITKELADLSVDEIEQLLRIYSNRITELSKKEGIKYVSVFKNNGRDAGTSIAHTHSQVIAYNIVPIHIKEEENVHKEKNKDLYGEIIESEKNSKRRIMENETMISFCPYASRFPMEAWIFPKRNICNITEFSEEEYKDFAKILKNILVKLKSINASYNFDLHYGIKNVRFHMEIMPRITKWAGFEHATGTIINVVSPEDAAKFYRD